MRLTSFYKEFIIVILVLLCIFILFSFLKENRILKQAINQYQNEIKLKDKQIKQVEEELEYYKKQEVLYVNRIKELQKKRTTVKIKENATSDEIVKAFNELGYRCIAR